MYQELLDGSVQLFVVVLASHSALPSAELKRRCAGLVGAGEALSGLMVRGDCSEPEAVATFTSMITAALSSQLR